MTDDPEDDLLPTLVDLVEILDGVNALLHWEVETRAGQEPLPIAEAGALSRLLQNPGSTLREIADATHVSMAAVPRLLAVLERRGLVEAAAPTADQTARYYGTEAAVELRAAGRSRATYHLRYSLTALTAQDRERLRAAAGALAALGAALGHRDIHPIYVDPDARRAAED